MDAELEFSVRPNTSGKQLFDMVTGMIGLREFWYFGLQFVDTKGSVSWLKPEKKIMAQDVKRETPLQFKLRIKFYPEDLGEELIQDVTRRLFFLQVKEDIMGAAIHCPPQTAVLLSSYVVQAKFGDYNPSVHRQGYLSLERLLPRVILEQQSLDELEDQIRTQHQQHKSMMKEEAMVEYLKVAQELEMFGVIYFEIQNKNGTDMWLGVDAHGVKISLKDDRLKPKIQFHWNEIKNIVYDEKKWVVKPVDRKWPEFIFTATPLSDSKSIIYWCTGNQEQYMQRRRADPIEVQQMKAQAQQEALQRRLERERLDVERRRREDMEKEKEEMERQRDELMLKLMQYEKDRAAAERAENLVGNKEDHGSAPKRQLSRARPAPVVRKNRAEEEKQKKAQTQQKVQTRTLQKDLFTDPKVFQKIDAYVIKVGTELYKKRVHDVKTVVQNITLGARTDLEKIRAIFVWLCHFVAYDVSGYLGYSKKLSSTEDVMVTGRAVCSGYAAVCKDMCRVVGIQCEEVSGHSKGSGYRQGQSFANMKSDHMWNAVLLGGEWFLLDACWGAGNVDMEKKRFTRRFKEFYFLTDPDAFIDTHFPDERKWQLLDPPISLEDFEKRVHRTADFFSLGLELIHPHQCHVFTYGGEADISIGFSMPLSFTYRISPQEGFQNSGLVRRKSNTSSGFLTVSHNKMHLRVVPPARGKYDVQIYAKLGLDAKSLDLVCSFIVECMTPTSMETIPENPFITWGLRTNAESLGVTSSSLQGYMVEVEDSNLQISLRTSRPLSMVCELVHPGLQASVTKRCLVTQIQPDLLTCNILFPSHGFYRLSVFVGDFEKKGLQLKNAANFLIRSRGRVAGADELFPSKLSTTCGPGSSTLEAGLSNFSHTTPFINTQQGKCSITFHNQRNLDILAKIKSDEEKPAAIPLSRYVFYAYKEQKVTLNIQLPEAGVYCLGLYAKTKSENQYSHKCDYVLKNNCNQLGLPFPTVYAGWKKDCELLEPLVGQLDCNSMIRFRVRVPGALEVGVFGETYVSLKRNNTGVWEGDVSSGNGVKQLSLAASWDQSSSKKYLLVFDVKS
ncbi:uncharacterized protein LOC128747072 [Synchiropus splendidus]|uniref:uncharacterized protein LOC128747072 n=1 Tax=Synchiropus splendidus TaxID=270530 RepID=UPI00237DCB85|nr:uncharacterized protein LOC128747072 [Synchiropus splendidus]